MASAAFGVVSTPVHAEDRRHSRNAGGTQAELAPYIQCVQYARDATGIRLYGDAHTWWDQAAGRYARGHRPQVGAIMAFQPHRGMQLGHVALVSKVVDSRNVLLTHANWSPINGKRGQLERNVRAVDVSPNNDWTQVRVWYAPINDLGRTAWPVDGFIYTDGKPAKRGADTARIAQANRPAARSTAQLAAREPVSAKPSRVFMDAFASLR